MKKQMVILALSVAAVAQAGTIWTEDFSDVTDWAVVNDPVGGSTVSSDGSIGYLKVTAASNQVSFAPAPDIAALAEFDATKKKNYALTFTVDRISPSCSYQLALDEFSSKTGGYVSTVWQVFPPKGMASTSGTFTVDLGKFTFSEQTRYIAPKILVNTGDGEQVVKMDTMKLEYIP
jgi:hypothetical protein